MKPTTVKIDTPILKQAESWGKKQSPRLNKKQSVEKLILKSLAQSNMQEARKK